MVMIMWIFLFVLVTTGSSHSIDIREVLEEDVDCRIPSNVACGLSDLKFSLRYKTLYNRCRTILETAECIVRVEEKCQFNDTALEMAKKQMASLKRVCGRESLSSSHSIDVSEALDEDVDCRIPTNVACKLSDLLVTLRFSGTLYDRCRTILETAECIVRVEEKCQFNDTALEMAKNHVASLKRVCGGESLITSFRDWRDIANLTKPRRQCTGRFLTSEEVDYCFSNRSQRILGTVKYVKRLLEKGIISTSDINLNNIHCITSHHEVTCLVATVENECGKLAAAKYLKSWDFGVPDSKECGRLQFKVLFPAMLEVYRENEPIENLLWRVVDAFGV